MFGLRLKNFATTFWRIKFGSYRKRTLSSSSWQGPCYQDASLNGHYYCLNSTSPIFPRMPLRGRRLPIFLQHILSPGDQEISDDLPDEEVMVTQACASWQMYFFLLSCQVHRGRSRHIVHLAPEWYSSLFLFSRANIYEQCRWRWSPYVSWGLS